MPRPVDSPRLTEVSTVLDGLSDVVQQAEDDLLSCLVVTGEPHAQQTIDAWVDHVVDVLRAVDEVTDRHVATLARSAARTPQRDTVAAPVDALEDAPTQPTVHTSVGGPWLRSVTDR